MALQNLPKTPPAKLFTKAGVVRELANEIKTLRKLGYPYEQIVEALNQHGLDITVQTLKNYLHKIKARRPSASKKKQQQTPTNENKEENPSACLTT